MAKAAHQSFSVGGLDVLPAGYGWQATLTLNPQETHMTITQYLPQWLRNRLSKPAPPKPITVSKKGRQVLPTLPKQSRSLIFSQDDSPAGYRVLWRL